MQARSSDAANLKHTWKTSELHSASRNSSSHSCRDETSGASQRDDDFVPFVGKTYILASISESASVFAHSKLVANECGILNFYVTV